MTDLQSINESQGDQIKAVVYTNYGTPDVFELAEMDNLFQRKAKSN